MVGHTSSYTVSKFGVNWTNGFCNTTILYPHPCSCSNTLPECQPLPLHLLLICHPLPTRCQFLYHCLHTTGLPVTRCESFAYSSASLRLGPEFTRSRLRKNLIICSLHPGQRELCFHGQMVPADEAHKNDPVKFLDYIESMLDDEISP